MDTKLFVLFKGDADDDKDDLYQQLFRNNNLKVVRIPVLSFNYTNLDSLRQKVTDSDSYSGVIFCSPRTVYSVEKAFRSEKNISCKEILRQKLIFPVGQVTSDVIKKTLSLQDSIGSEVVSLGCGEALAKYIVNNYSDKICKKLLMPCSKIATQTLTNILEENSISVDPIVTYEPCCNPNLAENTQRMLHNNPNTVFYMVFFSPSGFLKVIENIKQLKISMNCIRIICIGKTTQRAVDEAGFSVFCTSEKPTPEGLIKTVQENIDSF